MRHFAQNTNYKKRRRRATLNIRREERRLKKKFEKSKRLKPIADRIRANGKRLSEIRRGLALLKKIGEGNPATKRAVQPAMANLVKELADLKNRRSALFKDYNRERNS